MPYSVTTLSNAADCDFLLKLANKEKSDLEFRIISLNRQQFSYAESTVEIDSELQIVEAELSALETVIAALPDGEIKDDNITKKKKLELKQYLLLEKKGDRGSVALVEKEFQLARVGKELEEANSFITILTTRKAEF